MTATTCAVCEQRPTLDGYACGHCTGRAEGHLAAIIELAPDARLVAAGLVRRGRGGSGGKPASRPPLNDGATDVVDAVTNAMTTLARDIAETRGLTLNADAPRGPLRSPQSDEQGSLAHLRTPGDPMIAAARFLGTQLEWLRHAVDGAEPYAIRAFHEIGQCAGRLRGLVNGPSEQRYLGPCGSTVAWDDDGTEIERDAPCTGDVFVPLGGEKGTCKACKARWNTTDRQAWLNGEVRSWAFRPSEIDDAYGVNENTIRSWARRTNRETGEFLLASYWRTEAGLVTPWENTDDPAEIKARGPRLHYVGDVLDLAAADKARLAGEQAKRARRAAARAEGSEDAA